MALYFARRGGEALSQCRQKSSAIRISRGNRLKLVEIGQPRLRLVVSLAKNVVVANSHARNIGRYFGIVG